MNDASSSPTTVRVAQADLTSPLGNAPCAYWEWTLGRASSERFNRVDARESSEAPLALVLPTGTVEVPLHALRPHLRGRFERAIRRPEDLPTAIRDNPFVADLEDQFPVTLVEHRVDGDRDYYLHLGEETFTRPPPAPGEPPERVTRRVWHLSEEPFLEGRTSLPLTPRYVDWSG